MATAWPWPYPSTYSQDVSHLPKLTVEMNRADPFFERDATGWQFIDVWSGNTSMHLQLPENDTRTLTYNTKRKRPEDSKYQSKRIPPQKHY